MSGFLGFLSEYKEFQRAAHASAEPIVSASPVSAGAPTGWLQRVLAFFGWGSAGAGTWVPSAEGDDDLCDELFGGGEPFVKGGAVGHENDATSINFGYEPGTFVDF